MKVAITGGAGFLGRSVAQALLNKGIDVWILDTSNRLDSLKRDAIRYQTRIFEYPDVQNVRTLFKGLDVVIHLACTTEPASSMQSMSYDAATNIVPSLEIFQAAVDSSVQRVIFASSGGTVYGHPKTLPVTEEHPTNPMCAYGVSKLAIENYLTLQSSINGISLRIGNPYGSFQLHGAAIGLIANFLNAIRAGRPLEIWGDGSIVRDYMFIDDLANAFVAAVTNDSLLSGSYNIGSGMGWSISEIIEKLFSITDQKVPVNYQISREFDVPKIILAPDKFTAETGWKAHVTLEEGVLRLWEKLLCDPQTHKF